MYLFVSNPSQEKLVVVVDSGHCYIKLLHRR